MNNNETSTPNANKLNLDDGYKQQHTETPSILQMESKAYKDNHAGHEQ